jgi:hypothetical protein
MEMDKSRKLNKTLKISPEVHARLLEFGKKSETMDQIISRLLDIAEGERAKESRAA